MLPRFDWHTYRLMNDLARNFLCGPTDAPIRLVHHASGDRRSLDSAHHLHVHWHLLVVAIYDVFIQKHHTIRHNFPVVGHIRYWLEQIGPEMRQYWVANDKEEMPFNRDERSWIYASAKGENNNFGFGSTEQQYSIGYPIIKHAAFPFPEHKAKYASEDKTYIPCLKVMGESHGQGAALST